MAEIPQSDVSARGDAEEAWTAFENLSAATDRYREATEKLRRSRDLLCVSIGMLLGFAAALIGGWLHGG